MRVLVTGAAGFIGSHVVSCLLDHGLEVVATDGLLPPVHDSSIWPSGHDPRAEQVVADLRDPVAVGQLLDSADAVVHQAALVGHGLDLQDLPTYAGQTDLGTAVLLAGMAKAKVHRLVLASSMVVYGEGRYVCAEHGVVDPAPRAEEDLAAGHFEPRCPTCAAFLSWALVPESAPKNPQSVYASSKLVQEHYSAAWSRGVEQPVVALRYHNVYGDRMPINSPYSGVAAIFRSQALAGRAPTVYEDGGQMRDFVHVRDVARANLQALLSLPDLPGGLTAVNVCSGQPRSVLWAAQTLAAELGAPEPVITGQYRSADVRHIVASAHGAKEAIGFSADIHPESGFAEFATSPGE